MRLAIAAWLAGVVVAGPQFSGEYRIDSGATGMVRISPALGGTYAECRVAGRCSSSGSELPDTSTNPAASIQWRVQD